MIFTNNDKSNLPTITEIVEILKELIEKLPKVQRMPYERDVDSEFILTRTNLAYSIKPNIQSQSTLFLGYPTSEHFYRGPWWNFDREEFMIQNVLQEEMRIVMESHPMYKLFSDGFVGIRIFNPYGIGMAYGQKTSMLPLTSDIDIAAFFATHKVDMITGYSSASDALTGVLYLFELAAPMPYITGLSTIGKQPFLRSERMKLFGYETSPNMNFDKLPFVKGFEFRQDLESSKYIANKFSSEMYSLFPSELIADKIRQILKGKKVSLTAIDRNLKYNPKDNKDENIKRLATAGFEIVDSLDLNFTDDELNSIWYDNIPAIWHDFWKNVSFSNIRTKLANEIIDLPNNSQYKKYFVR